MGKGAGGYARDQGSQANGGGGYTKYQGSHHWGGGAIQDTRGFITGEVGLYKIPGVSSYMKVPSPQHARVGP